MESSSIHNQLQQLLQDECYSGIAPLLEEDELVQGAELEAAKLLLKRLWHREYLLVWPLLEGSADAPSPWSDATALLVAAIAAKLRTRLLALVAKSFTKITVGNAAALTGMAPDACAAEGARLGWELDAATGMFTVICAPPTLPGDLDLGALEHLTKQMIALDN